MNFNEQKMNLLKPKPNLEFKKPRPGFLEKKNPSTLHFASRGYYLKKKSNLCVSNSRAEDQHYIKDTSVYPYRIFKIQVGFFIIQVGFFRMAR